MSYTFRNVYQKPNEGVEINFWNNDMLALIDSYFDQGKITQKPIKTVDGLVEIWTTVFVDQAAYYEFINEPVNAQNGQNLENFCRGNSISYSLEGE